MQSENVLRKMMDMRAVLVVVTASVAIAESAAPAKPVFSPGRDTAIPWPGLEKSLIVYTPSNYDPAKTWPCIFFYHGMNGVPDTGLMRHYTAGSDSIVVAMEYVARGPVQVPTKEYLDILRQELETYRGVRQWVTRHVAVDPQRVYLAGASKGAGWPRCWASVTSAIWQD